MKVPLHVSPKIGRSETVGMMRGIRIGYLCDVILARLYCCQPVRNRRYGAGRFRMIGNARFRLVLWFAIRDLLVKGIEACRMEGASPGHAERINALPYWLIPGRAGGMPASTWCRPRGAWREKGCGPL